MNTRARVRKHKSIDLNADRIKIKLPVLLWCAGAQGSPARMSVIAIRNIVWRYWSRPNVPALRYIPCVLDLGDVVLSPVFFFFFSNL